MSENNTGEKFSIVIDINDNFHSYREKANRNKDEFVLFYSTWNDAGFYTLLNVWYFYKNANGEMLGGIRICHDDLKIDNNNEKARGIRHFLEEGDNSKGKISITDKLGEKYISIADSCLYDKLKEILKDDEVVNEFLSRLNEISTIKDDNNNERIEKIKSKDWYKKSFIRYDEEIVAFTECKNILGIKDNSYVVKKNLLENSDKINLYEYFEKIKTNIDGLYKWALNYDLSIEESKQVFYFIKVNHIESSEGVEYRNNVLKKIKDSYAEHTGFIKEINMLLKIDREDYIIINDIRNVLKVKEDELKNFAIGHYTRLDTIKILIKKKNNANENNGAYLRLTNGRQMNDPLEGKILLDYILDNNNLDKDLALKKWDPTYWYISSATTETDSLPMWKQYGGDSEGGMLVYDKDYLQLITKNEDVGIYRVCYMDVVKNEIKKIFSKSFEKDEIKKLEDNINHLKNKIKELKENIESLEGKLKKTEKTEKLELYISMLSDIAFLFKKYDYAYENEYRIVVNRAGKEEEIEEQVNPNYNFPFLYTYLKDKELKYSKLILGPKTIDIDYIAPYINYCDKDIEIERSSILYR